MTVGLSWTLLVLVTPVGRLGTIGEPLRRDKDRVWAKRDVKLHAHVQHVWFQAHVKQDESTVLKTRLDEHPLRSSNPLIRSKIKENGF